MNTYCFHHSQQAYMQMRHDKKERQRQKDPNPDSIHPSVQTLSIPPPPAFHLNRPPSLTLERRLEWPLGLRGDAREVAALAVLPVNKRRVLGDAVVPDHDGALLPLDAHLEVGAVGEVVVQELEERFGLLLLEADDVAGDFLQGVSKCQVLSK